MQPCKAEFKFKMKDCDVIYISLKVDGDGGKSKAKLYLAKDEFVLTIEAEDLSALRAAVNTWLRLIKMCEEIVNMLEVLV